MSALNAHDQAILKAIAKTIKAQDALLWDATNQRLKAIEKRLDEIPNLADAYAGSFDPERTYERGQLLTDAGSLWLCLHQSGARPGKSADWRLVAKGAGR
ncbi:MAG: hypothetical protein ACSLE2_12825 [Lysobacterales bacterium]